MSNPSSGLESPGLDEPSSIEPWLRPVLAAGLIGGAADCLGAATICVAPAIIWGIRRWAPRV